MNIQRKTCDICMNHAWESMNLLIGEIMKKEKIREMGLTQDIVSGDQADVNLPRGSFSRPPQPQC